MYPAANSNSANGQSETPDEDGRRSPQAAPPPPHHGSATEESAPAAILPSTLTPATTTRQSIALGVLSTLWTNSAPSTVTADNTAVPPASALPDVITHEPSPDAQEPPSDLTKSTDSVPSTTTTLTNTLPPTQSAALRALNAPAFQSYASSQSKSKTAKSTSSRTTLSSQPVVVRTYSGLRHNSRPSSGLSSPRLFPSMNGHTSQNHSALSAGLARRGERLPTVDDFSFSAILRAVDPEIRDAIDAIAEICARSRLSLADEYDAHLPPQGEITGAGPGWVGGMAAVAGRGRLSRISQGWSAAENTLTAVPEASSSSERLAGEGRVSITGGSSKKRSQSAYGSLKSVMSGGTGKRKTAESDENQSTGHDKSTQEDGQKSQNPAWAVNAFPSESNAPSITIITSPQASKQLSFDTSSTIKNIPETPEDQSQPPPALNEPRTAPLHRRHTSLNSIPNAYPPSSKLSSLASWLPWPRSKEGTSQELTRAETRLREVLDLSHNSAFGRGKATTSIA